MLLDLIVVATNLVLAHFQLLVHVAKLSGFFTQVDVPDLQVLSDLSVVVDLLPLWAYFMVWIAIVVGIPIHENVIFVFLEPYVVFVLLQIVNQVLLIDFSHALWAFPIIDWPQISVEYDAQSVYLALEILFVEEDHLLIGRVQILPERVQFGHDWSK